MDFLNIALGGHPLWLWLIFVVVVGTIMALDLGVANRKAHEVGFRESLISSGLYVLLALLFGGWVWYSVGASAAQQYLTGYIVEMTLSMDNIFVMSVIFAFFSVPRANQHRVLFWGILGVIILRGLLIALGATLVAQFEWVLYLFAAFLIFTGVKMLMSHSAQEIDVAHNPILKFLRGHFNITEEFHGQKFFVQKEVGGKLIKYITPLFVALIIIEAADVVFALDSIPAIFSITTDPYVVFTSNLFAIMGLRSMYFALAALVEKFTYLKVAMALILVFIGAKVLLVPLFGLHKLPEWVSLGVTVGLLAWGILWSLWKTRGNNKA